MSRSHTYALSLVLGLGLAATAPAQFWLGAAGGMKDDHSTQVARCFLDILPTEAQLVSAKGGWGGAIGAKPGAALVRGGVAIGGDATVMGRPAKLAMAAGRGALGQETEEGVDEQLWAGAVGYLTVMRPDVPFPSDLSQAGALLSQTFGAEVASIAASGNPVTKRIFWKPHHGVTLQLTSDEGKPFKAAAWVTTVQGQTAVGLAVGTGHMQGLVPRF